MIEYCPAWDWYIAQVEAHGEAEETLCAVSRVKTKRRNLRPHPVWGCCGAKVGIAHKATCRRLEPENER